MSKTVKGPLRTSTSPGADNFGIGLGHQITWLPVDRLKPFPDNPRNHSPQQVRDLARSITEFGWVRPIGVDDENTILFGHGCYEAARSLALRQVPTLTILGLSLAQKRAIVIADNRLAEKSDWSPDALKVHLTELIKVSFDVELTGFSIGAIDLLVGADSKQPGCTEEELPEIDGPAVSRLGDVWRLGNHRLICADSLLQETYDPLLANNLAEMVVTDPPYNVKIEGHARGRSRKKHREFAMASGEMLPAGFEGFLERAIKRAIQNTINGSIHYHCMDWRHLPELLRAASPLYSEWKNLLVWNKTHPGQGSFYRSQHELIAVFKSGRKPHINNFKLGSEGRNRTNVLSYPSGASSTENRRDQLAMHPTVKPVALIADLMRDCSRPNGLVLDMFGGSGTALLAAEETGRKARVIEIDPLYVDLSVRRWQKRTGGKAVHAQSGVSFDALARKGRAHG